MNLKNIHLRILLWFSLTLFFFATVSFVSFYLVTKRIIYHQVDRELVSHANQVSQINAQQFSVFSNVPGMVIILLDPNGSVISSSLGSNLSTFNFEPLYKKAKENNHPFFTDQPIGNTAMRIIVRPVIS